MTQADAIWRWTGNDDLAEVLPRFFTQAEDPTPSDDTHDMARAVEAKYRAMDLPADILETLIEGLDALVEEAEIAQGMGDGTGPDDAPLDPDGAVVMSLASSQMFSEDPFASLSPAQIAEQVQAQMDIYRRAVTEYVGSAGQSPAAFFQCTQTRLHAPEVQQMLSQAGMEDLAHIWTHGDETVYLRLTEPPRPGCIDIELGRAPTAAFEAVRSAI